MNGEKNAQEVAKKLGLVKGASSQWFHLADLTNLDRFGGKKVWTECIFLLIGTLKLKLVLKTNFLKTLR